jgi:16S rRNA (uracil1498-N3)-methyltransferase
MHRFFLAPDSFGTAEVRITGDIAEQIRRVLRMRPGDRLTLLDGLGNEYLAALDSYGKGEVLARVLEVTDNRAEPHLRVDIYLSTLNKQEKYEWALQKCTELGASRFVPLVADRSVSGALGPVRRDRWARIIREAAEQSGRGLVPALAEPLPFAEALACEQDRLRKAASGDLPSHLAVMPEVGQTPSLMSILRDRARLVTASLFIGPEGGFTPNEVRIARDAGVNLANLGPRILRAETAAVAGLAILMTELGEMEL